MSALRGRQVVLPLHLLPPIVREYPEIANQLRLRHAYILAFEQQEAGTAPTLVLRDLKSLWHEYEALLLAYPLLLQQLRTADCYLRALQHQRASAPGSSP